MRQIPSDAPSVHPLMRVPVPWVFVMAYLTGAGLQILLPVRAASPAAMLLFRLGGIALIAIGTVLAAWCLLIFREQSTTTVPFGASSSLVTWGPYRLSRNPMYVSLTLVYLGEASLLLHFWPLVTLVPMIGYLHWVVIPYEESRLLEAFGTPYEEYRARVGRWIGPW